ncbi:fimbrial protein [Providencia sneebia]|uniref:Fimbrial protein domain-containing protein n=1 Tax=Providencia sneebia DSM 19967 TaxID=1141660 RepID=K8WDA4_9GAMM|nr:fimbrial protein [Providencia sneebia]EKT54220.1 fimbrial protein domain-containing protein [Providencia sneebia DSM 19967]
MKKYKNKSFALVLSAILILMTGGYAFAAQNCVENGRLKHSTMEAFVDLKLSGFIKKNQELGRYTFRRQGGQGGVAICDADSQVYAYTTYSESTVANSRYYGDINGHPAYHVMPRGNDNFAYVLIDNTTGQSFKVSGQPLPVPEGDLMPIDATVILYAAIDNPKSTTFYSDIIGAILINPYQSGGGSTRIGYTYQLAGKVVSAPTSCSLTNTDLEFELPRISTTELPAIGSPTSNYSKSNDLVIDCTGKVSAKIKLQAANTTSYNGKESVIKTTNEGQNDNASGVGFIVKLPGNNNEVLVNQEFVRLADLDTGSTPVPLIAEYYRYNPEIKAGKLNAEANFVVQFN